MRYGFIVVIQLTGLAVIDFCSRYCCAYSFEKGMGMLLGRSSSVVAVKKCCVIGVRTYYGDLLQILRKWQDTVVMKQYH